MLPINGSLILGVISLTYIRPIDLCVLCVFVVRSSPSLARLYLRTHFTHQTLREPIN
ncbi:Similarity (fragment) [Microcystis aeruginosa PCC 9701]|uniref:Similarity n=1 Tax=Microcystis aeruginosa PCC 9701 TaxID=721123 RepID=I4IVU5_MICAE